MPQSSLEAKEEIRDFLKRNDLPARWLARRINRNDTWLSRRLRGTVPLSIDEYQEIKKSLSELTIK